MVTDWRSRYWKLSLVSSLASSGAIIGSYVDCTRAQIVPDGTLGAESSIVTPNDTIPNLPTDQIDGGAIRGANLFHSFSEFNVGEGRGAYFSNPVGIENILSRVTGGNPSNILGKLGVLGNANLFLINPNGIIFGPNASLNVGGSFVATTANAIQFADQGFFSASAPNTPPVLTVNPSAFLFNQIAHASIKNNSTAPAGLTPSRANESGLRVPDGRSLLLVGGDVSLESGGRLNALGGRVELGGLAEVGTVGLGIDSNTFSLNFTPDSLLSNVTLADDARVSVRGSGGGNIVVNTNTFTATNGGRLAAGVESLGNGGDITVNANAFIISGVGSSGVGTGLYNQTVANASGNPGNISVNTRAFNASSSATVASNIEAGAVGNAGNVNIKAEFLSLTNGARIQSLARGRGNAGNVSIDASSITFAGGNNNVSTGVQSNVEAGAVGNSGIINIKADSLSLIRGAQIQAIIRDASNTIGNAGSVNIVVRDTLTADGVSSDRYPSAVFSSVGAGAVGNGGDINIKAGTLSLTNGALLTARNDGQGNAGNITLETGQLIAQDEATISTDSSSVTAERAGDLKIRATDSVSLVNNSRLSTFSLGTGKGGNLSIETGNLTIGGDSTVGSTTIGQVDAGNITIQATDSVSVDNDSSISTSAIGTGIGGNIFLQTRNLSIQNESGVFSSTLGQGDAGDITVQATDSVSVVNNSLLSTSSLGVGTGGNLSIQTRNLNIQDGSNVFTNAFDPRTIVDTLDLGTFDATVIAIVTNILNTAAQGNFSQGRSGELTVRATDSLNVTNNGSLSTSATGRADGGSLSIETARLNIQDGGRISATTFGAGRGGNLNVTAAASADIVGTSADGQVGSNLSTESEGTGDAGDLMFTTRRLIVRDGAFVSTSTRQAGQGGSLTVSAPEFIELSGTTPDGQFSSGLFASTLGAGNAKDLRVLTEQLFVRNGAVVSVSTTGRGNAGSINLDVSDRVTLEGSFSGLYANTSPESTGDGGSIFIDSNRLTITNGAGVTVDSQGRGNAGNLQVQAGSVTLDREAFLSATTASGEGGNIKLRSQDILLIRRNSNISTAAGGTGNGGNIDIAADFIVALPLKDSNIIADALQGRGGNINITTQGVFGIQPRQQQTPLNDITASSELGIDGSVQINTPDVNPARGIVALPATVVDVTGLVAQSCPGGGGSVASSEFSVIGRGGLPPNPSNPLSSEAVLADWATLQEPRGERSSGLEATVNAPTKEDAPTQIVEAQGWEISPKGEVLLTAQTHAFTPHSPGFTPTFCH